MLGGYVRTMGLSFFLASTTGTTVLIQHTARGRENTASFVWPMKTDQPSLFSLLSPSAQSALSFCVMCTCSACKTSHTLTKRLEKGAVGRQKRL